MGDELDESRSLGGRIRGISEEAGGPSAERAICAESPAGAEKLECAEELAGAGRVFCAGEISGAVAIE